MAANAGLAVGYSHSLALRDDGTVFAWGDDSSGELGSGRKLMSTTGIPVVFPNNGKVAAAEAGRNHSLALQTDGTVWAWGQNDYGQLGDGTNTGRSVPEKVNGLSGVIAVAAGDAHSVAATSDGKVWAWGFNEDGELGNNDDTSVSTPVQVVNIPAVSAVKAGSSHTVALSNGVVWTWGDNSYGQLGDQEGLPRLYADQVIIDANIVAVDAGGDSTFAIDSFGEIWAWGRNDNFQLADGTTNDRATPAVIKNLPTMAAVSGGPDGCIAIDTAGGVWIWGFGYWDTPTYLSSSQAAVGVSTGAYFAQILFKDGTVWSTGDNSTGEIGDGTTNTTDAFSFVQAINIPPMASVSAGLFHALALDRTGTLWAWGTNSHGELGQATEFGRNVPATVSNLSNIVQIAAGDYHSLALKSDGTVWGWGYNFHGQAGDGTYLDRSLPVQIKGLPPISQIVAGGESSVAIGTDGSVWAWGDNGYGQLGIGSDVTRDSPTPLQIAGLSNVKSIVLGESFALALKSDGTVWGWGDNGYGQLGIGQAGDQSGPVQIPGLGNVVALGAGETHSLAVKSDGSVWAWGANDNYQLGLGDATSEQDSPVQVPGVTNVIAVDGGQQMSAALTSDGHIYTWGTNNNGELGNVDGSDSSTPSLADGDHFALMAAGYYHMIAMKSDGSTWGWGWNGYGQLGDGTLADQMTYQGVVNPSLTAFLDLEPGQPQLAIPDDKLQPFLVQTDKLGSDQLLTLSSSISLNSFSNAAAKLHAVRERLTVGPQAQGYNVYVAALVTGATVGGKAASPSIYVEGGLAGWAQYLGGPLAAYLENVAPDSDNAILVDILTKTNVSTLVGTQIYLGYGTSSDDMLQNHRFRLVYQILPPH
jgi:alpha-tubulin suppressor-like RCC1 family protein